MAWIIPSVASLAAEGDFCLTAELDASTVRSGANRFTARLDHRCDFAAGVPMLIGLWLIVRHGRG